MDKTRDVGFGPKVGYIGPKWDKSGKSGSLSQNVLKLILKSSRFVPFGANLTHFESKFYIPDINCWTRLSFVIHWQDFVYGFQRWNISFVRSDRHIGAFLKLQTPSEGLRCRLDFSFTVVNKWVHFIYQLYNTHCTSTQFHSILIILFYCLYSILFTRVHSIKLYIYPLNLTISINISFQDVHYIPFYPTLSTPYHPFYLFLPFHLYQPFHLFRLSIPFILSTPFTTLSIYIFIRVLPLWIYCISV